MKHILQRIEKKSGESVQIKEMLSRMKKPDSINHYVSVKSSSQPQKKYFHASPEKNTFPLQRSASKQEETSIQEAKRSPIERKASSPIFQTPKSPFSRAVSSYNKLVSSLNQTVEGQDNSHQPSSPINFSKSLDKSSNSGRSPANSFFKQEIVTSSKGRSKCQFSKLGLVLETVCTRENHQRSPVIFYCSKRDCQSHLKAGCAYCMLEDHGSHADQKVHLDEYLQTIQTKFHQYTQRVDEFENSFNELNSPLIISGIFKQIDTMKEQVCVRFDDIKTNISNQFHALISEEILITSEFISRQKLFSREIESAIKVKNIFQMSDTEREVCLRLFDDSEIQKISENEISLNRKVEQVSCQVEHAFSQLSSNLIYSLNKSFDRQNRLLIPPQKTDSFDVQIKVLEEIKNSISLQMKDYNQMQDQLNKVQKEIQQLKLRKQSMNFPYNLHGGPCTHNPQIICNTVPIFECCNQAFPCVQCHNQKDHLPYITIPSQRYCVNCLSIFSVDHKTNIPINCMNCLTDPNLSISAKHA